MQGKALKSSDSMPSDRFAQKARVLIDLFGPSGLERLQSAGLDPGMLAALERAAIAAPNTEQAGPERRNGLLARFREKGMLEAGRPVAISTPPRSADMAGSALSLRIAEHLQDGALETENPAVIAYVLRSQTKSVQAKVLRALPGSCARATMRHMKR